jgi:heterodisulfide reductase subunit A2
LCTWKVQSVPGPESNGSSNGSIAALPPKIGVYVCHCGLNIAGKVDIDEVVAFAASLPHVAVAREYKFMCSDPGQELIVRDIRDGLVNRVVVASCSPLMHEATFRRATEAGGISPFLFQMASIREHVSWVTADDDAATEKAKALVAGAVRRVAAQEPLERRQVPVHPDVLVVGGGIGGIHAALTLADAGKHVYLVERESTIGGHMAKFDKTFPTLDCAACILTPKMVQVGQHPNIELLSFSEVEEVSGYVGNFKVKVREKSRFIDEELCNGCDLCVEHCTWREIPSEFDHGLGTRPVAYKPFPQAIPSIPVIDRAGTSRCTFHCPAGIKAHGYVSLVRAGEYEKAFDLVLEATPLVGTLGRACYAQCEGECTRDSLESPVPIRRLKRFIADRHYAAHAASELQPPPPNGKRVAVIGSGPAGLTAAWQLARQGYAVKIFESEPEPGGMLRLAIPDYRLPAAVVERDIENVTAIGVEIATGTRVTDLDGCGCRATTRCSSPPARRCRRGSACRVRSSTASSPGSSSSRRRRRATLPPSTASGRSSSAAGTWRWTPPEPHAGSGRTRSPSPTGAVAARCPPIRRRSRPPSGRGRRSPSRWHRSRSYAMNTGG